MSKKLNIASPQNSQAQHSQGVIHKDDIIQRENEHVLSRAMLWIFSPILIYILSFIVTIILIIDLVFISLVPWQVLSAGKPIIVSLLVFFGNILTIILLASIFGAFFIIKRGRCFDAILFGILMPIFSPLMFLSLSCKFIYQKKWPEFYFLIFCYFLLLVSCFSWFNYVVKALS